MIKIYKINNPPVDYICTNRVKVLKNLKITIAFLQYQHFQKEKGCLVLLF